MIRVPANLIFNGDRPLSSLPHYDIFNSNFSEESCKAYTTWAKRRGMNPDLAYRKKQAEYFKDHDTKILKIETYSRDRFNIRDGHHRVCINTSNGIKSIQLEGTPDQEACWIKREERVNEILTEILAIKGSIYQPVDTLLTPHRTERSSYDRLEAVTRALYHPSTYQIAEKGTCADQPLDVLDIGSNYGFFSNWLSRLGHNVVGIDPSPKVNFARRLANAYWLPTQFEEATFQDYDKEADVMLDLSVCWHLMWSHKTMSEEDFVDKINKQCKQALIAEVKSTHLQKYIELITTRTHLTNVKTIGKVPYFQDPGGRELLMFGKGPNSL